MVLVVLAASLVCILSTSVRFAFFFVAGHGSPRVPIEMVTGKSLSETSSEDSSELSSHQMAVRTEWRGFLRAERSSNSTPRTTPPRYSLIKSLVEGLCRLGTTTAKGPSMKPSFEFNHYAIGGVMGHKHCLCLCPPLRLRGRTGVFRRLEGYLLATLLWVSPSASSSDMVGYVHKAILMPRCAACGSGAKRVRVPFFLVYLSLVSFACARWLLLLGHSDVFPGCGEGALLLSHIVRHRFCVLFPPSRCVPGRPDVLSWPRLRAMSSSSARCSACSLSFPRIA